MSNALKRNHLIRKITLIASRINIPAIALAGVVTAMIVIAIQVIKSETAL